MSQRPFKEVVEAIGGEGGCDSQSAKFDVTLLGPPLEGTFLLIWPTLDAGVPAGPDFPRLEFNISDNAAAAKAVMVTHPNLTEDDIDVEFGPWPTATMRFTFKGAWANKKIIAPVAVWTYMSGGYGLGIMCAIAQEGHS